MKRARSAALVLLAGGTLAAAGCGGGGRSVSTPVTSSSTVDVYSSLPLRGPDGARGRAILTGIRLALVQSRGSAGRFTVDYRSLDDSAGGGWDPGRTLANARAAAIDPRAVYYIGEQDSDASKVSIPVLNESGVAQLSPASTYVGLTTNEPGAAAHEPQEYYPSGERTFLRIVPRDTVQATAALTAVKQDGCTRVAVADDRSAYGAGLAEEMNLAKGRYGVTIASDTAVDPASPSFRAYASAIRAQRVDCFYFAGGTSAAAVQIFRDVNALLPSARLYGPDRICVRAVTATFSRTPIGRKIQCTEPVLAVAAHPGGRAFLSAYRARYGIAPDPYAIYGYEAMRLGLTTIASLGPQGDQKSAVRAALFALKDHHSVLGTYGFDANGDITLRTYGLYRVGSDGAPQFERAVVS